MCVSVREVREVDNNSRVRFLVYLRSCLDLDWSGLWSKIYCIIFLTAVLVGRIVMHGRCCLVIIFLDDKRAV